MISRPGFMFALAVSVAALLSLAMEHARAQPAGENPAESSVPDNKGTPQNHTGTKGRGSTGWTGGSREQTKAEPGVGSRALTGQDQERAADQPEMATGVDLKGPPVRFPPAKTPE
jgi:opacity protein-like surface antigen